MSKHIKAEGDWKFKRQRDGDKHVTNCSDGYRKITLSEIHHILCVHACSDANMARQTKDYIHLCMAMTDWDINLGHNNIGLPKKWAYVHAAAQQKMIGQRKGKAGRDEVNKQHQQNSDSWDGLPCHQVDHPNYLTAVEDWVKEKIWNELESAKKEMECDRVVGKNIASMFDKAGKHWKTFLQNRGKEEGGTKHCMEYASRPKSDTNKWGCDENTWFIPFSMDPGTPRKRNPPARGGSIQRDQLLNLVD